MTSDQRELLRGVIEALLFIKTLLIFLWGRYQKSTKKETNHD